MIFYNKVEKLWNITFRDLTLIKSGGVGVGRGVFVVNTTVPSFFSFKIQMLKIKGKYQTAERGVEGTVPDNKSWEIQISNLTRRGFSERGMFWEGAVQVKLITTV